MGSINWKWLVVGAVAGYALATYGPKLPFLPSKG
jgi:hypothetical protein